MLVSCCIVNSFACALFPKLLSGVTVRVKTILNCGFFSDTCLTKQQLMLLTLVTQHSEITDDIIDTIYCSGRCLSLACSFCSEHFAVRVYMAK